MWIDIIGFLNQELTRTTVICCDFAYTVLRLFLKHPSKMSRISWVLFIIFIGGDIHYVIWHHDWAMTLEVCRAHHHGCHSSHQIWTLPIVPLNAIVANHTGWGWVIYAIQVGWTTSFKPPTWRKGNVPESSRQKSELIELKPMKYNTQMYSCESAVTLQWRGEKMKYTLGNLQEGG